MDEHLGGSWVHQGLSIRASVGNALLRWGKGTVLPYWRHHEHRHGCCGRVELDLLNSRYRSQSSWAHTTRASSPAMTVVEVWDQLSQDHWGVRLALLHLKQPNPALPGSVEPALPRSLRAGVAGKGWGQFSNGQQGVGHLSMVLSYQKYFRWQTRP